jgi:mRNA interferase RelE/StbE
MTFQIRIAPRAERDLKSLPNQIQTRIRSKIDALAEDPFPQGVKKLVGEGNLYRLRLGDYRVLYTVEQGELVILIISVGHRREVYRRRT